VIHTFIEKSAKLGNNLRFEEPAQTNFSNWKHASGSSEKKFLSWSFMFTVAASNHF